MPLIQHDVDSLLPTVLSLIWKHRVFLQIRQAYRNLLTKTHPDKGGDPAQFDRIKAAYEVLADPEKVTLFQVLTLVVWCAV